MASALEYFDSHFASYLRCFQIRTRSVEKAARQYLHGLFQNSRRNMECMAETVADSRYQPLHHMLSESDWDRRGVRRQVVRDANAHFGYPIALLLDESGLAKKGCSLLASPANGTVAGGKPITARLVCLPLEHGVIWPRWSMANCICQKPEHGMPRELTPFACSHHVKTDTRSCAAPGDGWRR